MHWNKDNLVAFKSPYSPLPVDLVEQCRGEGNKFPPLPNSHTYIPAVDDAVGYINRFP